MQLCLDGDPVSWARPRFNNGRGFTAPKQAAAKTDIQWMLYQQWGAAPLPRPTVIYVEMHFYFKASKKSDIGRHKTTRPDIDNLVKLVLDGGNGIVWEDDAQVAHILLSKRWGETARTLITVKTIERTENGVSQ